ncbi:MAG: hypothetical protein ACK5LT_03065 [Lachnospirales bacterium]
MQIKFNDEHKKEDIHKVDVEDIYFEGEYLNILNDNLYQITGTAIIEGEKYNNFTIEFTLLDKTNNKLEDIMKAQWDEYDFIL